MYNRRYNYYNNYHNSDYNRRSYNDYLYDYYRNRDTDRYNRRSYGPRRSRRSYPWYLDRDYDWRRNRDDPSDEEEEVEETLPEEVNKEFHVEEIQLNIKDNAKLHHTHKYHCTMDVKEPILVIRRGEPFEIKIRFDRAYNKEQNQINFRFYTGNKPTPAKYTEDTVIMEEDSDISKKFPRKWFVKLEKNLTKEKSITVKITPPFQCIIGQWMFKIETESRLKEDGENLKLEYKHNQDFFVLFNPYCQDDSVYMSTTDLLDEYIQCEGGALFIGNASQPGVRPWNHGQFYGKDGFMLKTCLHIIRKAYNKTVDPAMADPMRVARVITKMVNAPDDDGILVGRWDGKYKDGTRPTSWTGSTDIIKEYHKNGGKSVKYGQCWVFSALTTTLCRCLGIPCRSVTNFQSAHDTNNTATTDKFFKKKGDDMEEWEEMNTDSVWNFHVWNECWLKRPDIKEGDCDGWQVIDATPQELSEGQYRCGPCPVSAIKKGDITKNYDASFIFAEVNSDRLTWLFDDDIQEWTVIECDPHNVGQKISTKIPDGKPYRDDPGADTYSRWHVRKYREDLTHAYKFMEGTIEERMACKNADKTTGLDYYRDVFFTHGKEDVSAEILITDGAMPGEDFTFKVVVSNVRKKRADRSIKHMQILVDSFYYTGTKMENILTKKMGDFDLGFQEKKEFEVTVKKEDYWGKTTDYFDMVITARANIESNERGYGRSNDFQKYLKKQIDYRLRRPDIKIETKETVQVGRPFEAKFTFKNPLHVKLTNCKIHISGNSIKDITRDEKDVPPKGEFSQKYELEAEVAGEDINITATFDCDEIQDISGSTSITAKE